MSTPQERLTLPTSDGYPTAATRFRPAGEVRARLVVAGATGVPQGFYRRFATFASERGFDTLTLDYRGVGLSAPASLRGFRTDFLEWGRVDLAAAVDVMGDGSLPLVMVGHSYGGHALGLLPNHERIAACYTFATGAGWHGWMPWWEQIRVLAMWRVIGPAMVAARGYLAWSRLGMGEDLPRDVYRQWRHWCRFPHYFFDDPEMGDALAGFARVRTPIVAANALDDGWAPPRSRDAFMRGYRNAPWEGVDIDPRAAGTGPIGHMGYFRGRAEPLWETALGWLSRSAALP